MKTTIAITIAILLILTGCGGGTKQSEKSNDGFFTIDVTKNYPEKDFILQDLLDVEYIPLETNEEFISQGVPLAIGNEIILIRNYADREILIFDRNGKGIRKINRHGQGGEEYMYNHNAFLDEKNSEIVISDRNILVYDLHGNFKRSFDKKKDANLGELTDFDGESFIWRNDKFDFDMEGTAVEMPSFFIASKQDGSILREIEIPMEQRKTPIIMWREGEMIYSTGPHNKTIIPFKNELILTEASSDTVYRYTNDHRLIPFIARTPSLQSMNPEVFLLPGVVTDSYCFMDIYTKQRGVEDVSLALDRQTGEIFRYTVYNGDYTGKEETVPMYSTGKNGNRNIAFCRTIQAEDLIEAYEKDQLKGRLKEIAAELEEDANAVIMLGKYR